MGSGASAGTLSCQQEKVLTPIGKKRTGGVRSGTEVRACNTLITGRGPGVASVVKVAMRRARLAAILVVVVGLVMAGCGGGEGTVEVTGHTNCVQTHSTGSGPPLGGALGTSEETSYDCDCILSDERVSGKCPGVVRFDLSVNGDTTVGAISGTVVISNEGGTWEGTVSGTTTWTTTDRAHVHVIEGVFLGTGDYEGLRFLIRQEGTGFPWTDRASRVVGESLVIGSGRRRCSATAPARPLRRAGPPSATGPGGRDH